MFKQINIARITWKYWILHYIFRHRYQLQHHFLYRINDALPFQRKQQTQMQRINYIRSTLFWSIEFSGYTVNLRLVDSILFRYMQMKCQLLNAVAVVFFYVQKRVSVWKSIYFEMVRRSEAKTKNERKISFWFNWIGGYHKLHNNTLIEVWTIDLFCFKSQSHSTIEW